MHPLNRHEGTHFRLQMDTFPDGTRPQQSFMEYDDAAKPQGENFDVESQAVTEEFKSRRPSY